MRAEQQCHRTLGLRIEDRFQCLWMRIKLAPDGVHVAALHLGYADTPMTRRIDAPKLDPDDVVRAAYDGLEAGDFEILADDLSRQVKAGLAGPIEGLYPQLAGVSR